MHKWKMPGTEKCQNYKEGEGIRNEEYAGYYCLVLAIVCGLNAAEAWKIYQYGPDHPLSKKILKRKIRDEIYYYDRCTRKIAKWDKVVSRVTLPVGRVELVPV